MGRGPLNLQEVVVLKGKSTLSKRVSSKKSLAGRMKKIRIREKFQRKLKVGRLSETVPLKVRKIFN